MAKCTGAASIYGDICFTPGTKSLPGVRGWVFGIAKRDILGWPTIGSETPKTMDAVAKYTGDFKLASDKKWHKIGLIPNESQLQVESQGTLMALRHSRSLAPLSFPAPRKLPPATSLSPTTTRWSTSSFSATARHAWWAARRSLLSSRSHRTSARLLPIPTLQQCRLLHLTSIQLRSTLARSRPRTVTSPALPACLS